MVDSEVGLADAIRSLRQELSEAMAEGRNDEVRFRLGPVELEFKLGVTVGAKAGGGVRFWVLSADAGGSTARATEHRIKLTLQPVGNANADLLVQSEEHARPE